MEVHTFEWKVQHLGAVFYYWVISYSCICYYILIILITLLVGVAMIEHTFDTIGNVLSFNAIIYTADA